MAKLLTCALLVVLILFGQGGEGVSAGPLEDFATRFYADVLERTPDPGGLAGWVGFLRANCNAQGFDAIARGFFDSLEFRTAKPQSLNGLVTLLYRSFLGREPDPGGLAGWAGLIRQARLTMALQGFIPSREFQSLLPDRTNRAAVTAVVTRLYQQVLGRDPEPAGLDGWVNFIAATGNLEAAATGFLASQELESHHLTFRDYVTILYRTFLNRDPEPAGLDGWEGVLRTTLLQVINAGFVPSAEFQGQVSAICLGAFPDIRGTYVGPVRWSTTTTVSGPGLSFLPCAIGDGTGTSSVTISNQFREMFSGSAILMANIRGSNETLTVSRLSGMVTTGGQLHGSFDTLDLNRFSEGVGSFTGSVTGNRLSIQFSAGIGVSAFFVILGECDLSGSLSGTR